MTECLVFGRGAIQRLPRLLERWGAHRVFLITGRTSFDRCGAAAALRGLLPPTAVVGRFCEFSENPRMEDVCRGIEQFRQAAADALVAIGGGSALDMGKLVNVLSAQPAAAVDVVTGRAVLPEGGVPLVAVPTTAGSGSEATHFAVAYVDRTKYSVAGPSLRPKAAIVDPGLTASQSPALTAVTGMDAFSQAVESFWSVHSTDASKAHARRAIALVLAHLPAAVHTGGEASRRGMSKAAYLAGRAIDLTKTTGAHATSYPLTSYFGVPHGHAVGLTLGQWLLFNSGVTEGDVTDRRGSEYVRGTIRELAGLFGCADAPSASARIDALMASIGLATRLRDLGISEAEALDTIVPNVNVERLVNNPRAMNPGALRQLITAVA